MLQIALLFVLLFVTHAAAAPTEAERIKRGYGLSAETWELKMKIASDPEERRKLIEARPDPAAAAAYLWRQIAPSLKEDWIIPYAGFFLELTRGSMTDERQRLLKAFGEHHLAKPGLAPFCIALANSGDPKSLPLLEKILAQNPDEPTKGIAALGAALLLKSLGGAPEVMQKRLTYLRQAIIMAADRDIGGVSVADIVTDELYVIRHLAKDRTAPDFSGADVSGRVIRLAELRGKTVVLLFWDAKSPETDKFIGLTNQMAVKYEGKPVAILGVTPESLDRISELQADGSIRWNNLIDPADKLAREYRIAARPAAFIIGPDGKIEYAGLPGSFAELTVDALLAGDSPKE